jgi:Mg2+ and Co2+ transporter CorA
MMSFLTCMTGFFMNFELLPILTDYNFIPLFSILSLAAILVVSRDHRTQFWKGAIQESFQQSLVENGSVV